MSKERALLVHCSVIRQQRAGLLGSVSGIIWWEQVIPLRLGLQAYTAMSSESRAPERALEEAPCEVPCCQELLHRTWLLSQCARSPLTLYLFHFHNSAVSVLPHRGPNTQPLLNHCPKCPRSTFWNPGCYFQFLSVSPLTQSWHVHISREYCH